MQSSEEESSNGLADEDSRVYNRNPMTLSPTRRQLTILVPILMPLLLTGAIPQIWFYPLDPLFRPEVNWGGSPPNA